MYGEILGKESIVLDLYIVNFNYVAKLTDVIKRAKMDGYDNMCF